MTAKGRFWNISFTLSSITFFSSFGINVIIIYKTSDENSTRDKTEPNKQTARPNKNDDAQHAHAHSVEGQLLLLILPLKTTS